MRLSDKTKNTIRLLEKTIIRFQILADRMEACPGDHQLSRMEIAEWKDETQEVLDALR